MEKAVMKLAYVISGFLIGLITGIKFTNDISGHRNFFIIAFVIVGIIIALWIENSVEKVSEKVFYLVFSFILVWPIACIFEYLGAGVVFIWEILKAVWSIWF